MTTHQPDDQVWSTDEADNIYGVSRWGEGYFHVGEGGDIVVTPRIDKPSATINLREIVEEVRAEGIQDPVVIRFQDILHSQVIRLNRAFQTVMEEAAYQGAYRGVFPIKVNQMREVVEEIVDAGAPFNFGLEAGSKPELLAALAYNRNEGALTILNGYKDEEYLRLALLGQQMGRNIVIVIEKASELKQLIPLIQETGIKPMIGLRCKLHVKGEGRWENSGGERAKFGLSYVEIMRAIEQLRQAGLLDLASLLHFHIGSQVTDARSIKEAVQEAAMIYVNLVKSGLPLKYLDVGGGLAVDYDGGKSTSQSSCNYNLENYVSDVVWGVKQVCEQFDAAHPDIVSESGRAITAHHSCFVTRVMGEIKHSRAQFNTQAEDGEHALVANMRGTAEELNTDNFQEMYNDLKSLKEQSIGAFNLGVLTFQEMAKIEALYWSTLDRISRLAENQDFTPEDFKDIPEQMSSSFLANFSVFQSAIDVWSIGQLLPIVPISRLDEKPRRQGDLADITCDSDGKVDSFLSADGVKPTLPLHDIGEDEDYYIGVFLTGAYQDAMGDMHNLFGRVNEVHIFAQDDDPNGYYIEEIIRGATMERVLTTMQYSPDILNKLVKSELDLKVKQGKIAPRVGVKLDSFYEECLSKYTYLRS